MMYVLRIDLPNDSILALNGMIVYVEDYTEHDCHNDLAGTQEVAARLVAVLGCTLHEFDLSAHDLFLAFMVKHNIDRDEWNYDDFMAAAIKELGLEREGA